MAVDDAGLLSVNERFLGDCLRAAEACAADSTSKLFSYAERARSSAEHVFEASRQLSWFQAPRDAVEPHATQSVLESARRAAELVAGCFESQGAIAERAVVELTALRDNHATTMDAFATRELAEKELAITPWKLMLSLLSLPSDWTSEMGVDDPQTARAASPLSEAQIAELTHRMTAHLVPAGSVTSPGLSQSIWALVLTDRCLIAHRCAESMFELLSSEVDKDPARAAAAIGHQRNRGGINLATHGQVVRFRRDQELARAAENAGALAIATAELYAAAIEGHVKRMGANVLDLLGRSPAERATSSDIRDALLAHAPRVGLDLASSIVPEWRNAVDHRSFHWDPLRNQLWLRDTVVAPAMLDDLQSAGSAAYQGAEAGTALACAIRPELNDAVRTAAPASDDGVIIVHRLRETLARLRVPATAEISGSRITVKAAIANVPGLLQGLLESLDDFLNLELVDVDFSDAPTLLIRTQLLHGAAELASEDSAHFGPLTFCAVFADALVAHGASPESATNRCAGVAARHVEARFAHVLSTDDRNRGAALVDAASIEANRLLRNIEDATGARTPQSRDLHRALGSVSEAARLYQRGQDPEGRRMMMALRRVKEMHEALGPATLPWF